MSREPVFAIGFDPGGIGQFGWCLVEATDRTRLGYCGVSNHDRGAVDSVCKLIDDSMKLLAAGIDSPMFWVEDGDRRVDQIVRAKMHALGARNVWGTVQSVNSLRGACLVQGILAARLLRSRFPSIRITESHPKALLWMMGVANKNRPVRDVQMADLSKLIDCDLPALSEHERDAALGAVAALAMLRKLDGWRDLALEENDAFVPVSPVEYWMPINDACGKN